MNIGGRNQQIHYLLVNVAEQGRSLWCALMFRALPGLTRSGAYLPSAAVPKSSVQAELSGLQEITSDNNRALGWGDSDQHFALESKQLLIFVSQLSPGEELSNLRCYSVSFQATDSETGMRTRSGSFHLSAVLTIRT